ncbi:Ribonuclease P protein subunit p21 [Coemansia sp. RSA 720]|nr:Ribonuclease P protein subunit p21 [Coemansia sp. RSA 720]
MGRNGKEKKGKKGGGVPNRELYERMSFLYQSAQMLSDTTKDGLLPLARFYTKEMRQVARKSVLRLSPHVKRRLCKVCNTPKQPGISCRVRVKGSGRAKRVITTCTYCGDQTRLMANAQTLFVDQSEHTTQH